MTRPVRSTRGQRNPISQQQKNHDNQFYEQVFATMGNEDVAQSPIDQQMLFHLTRKDTASKNILRFPYSRGYHYFFDLNCFPRMENSFSYAIDAYNALNVTYKDNPHINRIYFGLPPMCPSHSSRDIRGDCHEYLFNTEHKKIILDQLLITCKAILKQFQSLSGKRQEPVSTLQDTKIASFYYITTDADLSLLFKKPMTKEKQKQLIQRKIQILIQRKKLSLQNWQLRDQTYFYHSLNNKLQHQIALQRKKYNAFTIFYSIELFFGQIRACIKQGLSFKHLFMYCDTSKRYFSEECCKKLDDHLCQIAAKQLGSELMESNAFLKLTEMLPIEVMDFGREDLMKLADTIIGTRISNQSQSLYYSCRSVWKRLFKRELTLEKQTKCMPLQVYMKLAHKKAVQVKKYLKERKQMENKSEKEEKKRHKNNLNNQEGNNQQLKKDLDFHYPDLDEYVDWSSLTQKNRLIKTTEEVALGQKELIILILYHKICQSLNGLSSMNDSAFTHLVSSELYRKYEQPFIQATESAKFGALSISLQLLCDTFSQSFSSEEAYNFAFIQSKCIGVLSKSVSEEWETQKQDQSNQFVIQNDIDYNGQPTKRIKYSDQIKKQTD